METIFRKVYVHYRLPDKNGDYLTDKGILYYNENFKAFKFGSSVEYWLEEIELPADKEIKKLAKQYSQSYWGEVPGDTLKDLKSSFEGYGRYLLNKLKS